MSVSDTIHPNRYAYSSIFSLVIAAFFFFFAVFVIDPRLIFYAQEPVFFYSGQFMKNFINYPGAPSLYISNLFAQFFYFRVIGALIITLLLTSFYWIVRSALEPFGKAIPLFEYTAVFIASLLIMQFKFPLVVLVSLILSVGAFVLFTKVSHKKVSVILVPILAIILYFVVSGAFFVFALLVILYSLKDKKIIFPVIMLLLAIALPLSSYQLFLTTYKQVFLYPFAVFSDFIILSVSLYALVPVSAILLLFFSKFYNDEKKFVLWIQFAVILAGIVIVNFASLDKNEKCFWKINHFAEKQDWQGVLDEAQNEYLIQPQVLYQINRALAHTGKLGDELFDYEQHYGMFDLFLHEKMNITSPRLRGDIFFDLGNFNESKHWTHEAVTTNGETLFNLKRLVLIYLLYDKKKVAEKYIHRLKQTLIARGWAKHYEQFLNEKSNILDDPVLADMAQREIKKDFLTFIDDPESDLINILKLDANNKLAFHYLSALYLLQKRITSFSRLQQEYKHLCGPQLPKNFQEALVYKFARDKKSPNVQISPDVVNSFKSFFTSLQKNSKNSGIKSVLQMTHGKTYWYYLTFVEPAGM